MAIYHMSIKNISRAKGKTAIAAAAYRAGTTLQDQETGITHSYTKKTEVAYTEIILPEHAPEEYRNREILWNEVQKVETQDRARLAREWEVAIPNELDLDQAKTLIRNFGESLVKEGMCIDLAIHWKNGNHHAHIMGTTRPIGKDGKWAPKERKGYKLDAEGNKIPVIDPKTGKQKIGARGRKMWQRETVQANDWNRREKVEEWRKRWADCCNKYLAKEQQIDHRSYERQGITLLPTVHEGYTARKMESLGNVSDLCQLNRGIREYNEIDKLQIKINKQIKLLQEKIKGKEAEREDYYTLMIQGCYLAKKILSRYGNQWAELYAQTEAAEKAKDAQRMVNMLAENIKDTEDKYKQEALRKRGFFAALIGSDGMTDEIKEKLEEATAWLRMRLKEEQNKLDFYTRNTNIDKYNKDWYSAYTSDDIEQQMSFVVRIEKSAIGAQMQSDADYKKLVETYEKYAPIAERKERKERMEELARYNANYRNRSSRDNQYTID